MKFKQSLTKVILLLFSFFFGSVPEQTPFTLSAAANSVDEELQSIGMKEDVDYPLDIESNDEISTLLFLENKEKYYIYFYLPKGIYNYEFLTIQLGIAVGIIETINDDSNLEINNYSLNYIDMTSNGTVSKYEIQGIDSSLHTYSNRRYSIRQTYVKYSNELKPNPASKVTFLPYWQTLGDEYHYYKDENNKTQYNYKKAVYVSLLYKDMWSYYFNTVSPFLSWMGVNRGQEHYFYGFTPDRPIDTMQEIEIMYNSQSITAYKARIDSPFYQPTDQANDSDRKYSPIYGEVNRNSVIVLEGEVVEIDSSVPKYYKAKKTKWNRISTYSEMIKNADESLATFIETNFLGSTFIVNFAGFDYKLSSSNLFMSTTKCDEFIDYLNEHHATYIPGPGDKEGYSFHQFTGTHVSQAQMIRMRYENDGKEYNLQVITDPIDSSGNGYDTSKPGLPWWIYAILIVLAIWIISLIIRILSPIFKLIGSFFSFIFSGFKKDK